MIKICLYIIIIAICFSQDYVKNIPTIQGYKRVSVKKLSFQEYLRDFQINKTEPVLFYNKKRKSNQNIHYAVLNIDIGTRNIQQCADAVMRMRAEYLFQRKEYSKIKFNFTSGHNFSYDSYLAGLYSKVSGNKVEFKQGKEKQNTYVNFRKYLDVIFTYAGTYSLRKESKKIRTKNIKIGDFFIQGGFPGHAMIIIDLTENNNGEKMVLLAQSYMPAQSIHIVKNLENNSLSPWFKLDSGEKLVTPEWVFEWNDLYRFN